VSIHPRLSVHQASIGDRPLDDDLEWICSIGARWLSVAPSKLEALGWESGIDAVRQSGLQVSSVLLGGSFALTDEATWPATHAAATRSIDLAAALHANCVYGVTGARAHLTFEEGADAYRRAVGPLRQHAKALHVPLALETLNPTYISFNLCGGLQDAIEVAEIADVSLCLDISGFFAESHLLDKFKRVMPRTALVQLSDTVYGEIGRAVPGDGNIPFEQILGWMLQTGYAGPFEIELNGRRIEQEGKREATLRGAQVLSDILERLDA
jgi:sugar phosphate isomerase/epimerase